MFSTTQRILDTDNIFAMYKNTVGKDITFTPMQTFIRLTFKGGLRSNAAKRLLLAHYGTQERLDEASFKACEALLLYKMALIRKKLNYSESNATMRWLEKEMAVFGLTPKELRSPDLITELCDSIAYNTIEF